MAMNSNVALISPHDTQAEVFDCVECGVGLGFYAHFYKIQKEKEYARYYASFRRTMQETKLKNKEVSRKKKRTNIAS